LLTGLVFFTQNPIHKRYRDLLENSDKTDWQPAYSNGKKQHFNNLTLRFFLWETALSNINEHNLWIKGCGNGGVIPLQKEKISEYGTKNELLNVDPPLWNFNIHNMYLQSLMMLGLPGLFVFILILFYPFTLVKYLNEKAILVFFNCSIIIFMIQESAFQTQAGIVFYTIFSMVFYSYVYSLKDKSMQDEMKFITQVQAP
jgi:O-antigen ligase